MLTLDPPSKMFLDLPMNKVMVCEEFLELPHTTLRLLGLMIPLYCVCVCVCVCAYLMCEKTKLM